MHDADVYGSLQANWLKSVGIQKGDAVAIYMPMICELPSEELLPSLWSSQVSKLHRILPWACIA